MTERPSVVTTFKDIPHDEAVSDAIERRCEHLAKEFHELSRVEITLAEEGVGITVHGHATGKFRDVGAQAEATEALPAVERVLGKIERQLRTAHDKQIFTQRREAQRHPPKKRSAS
ncbi:MAG: HPF/RaiA family ribosome-associated protein [Myxococcota bacterium]|nr:HPF/RaiA family ribosome-associated protein [Myxococcota bacterium]